ncbi:9a996eab-2dd8-4dd7-9692-c612cbd263f8 [Thermothielavioides terrestris]|uniref:Uncharacterized protein n=2 Tax=Thermothielavioides terrestris TaxID=2587410 RepID=G2QZ78_THETT|nr:uncharacterized protein THITE_152188 [Thermothielavioides terrestris NRRL 8126]AEO66314.1 hypothetical protein THITE_152188 [Thermothielavioides terrestris NRRL 8126]SPQ25424.1 9a996eab-2dd8-4dd7-9692-c612cbd263f8 [Thermothielavioides terrestris]
MGDIETIYESDSDSDSGTATPKDPPGSRRPSEQSEVSEVSYFSNSNLPEDDPHRRIPASEVRAQAIAIPARTVPYGESYPHRFNNHENLPLSNTPPLIEHPVTPSGPYVAGTPPGPARIIVNAADRSKPEVVYHDPSRPATPDSPARHAPFSKAEYRGKDRSVQTGLED